MLAPFWLLYDIKSHKQHVRTIVAYAQIVKKKMCICTKNFNLFMTPGKRLKKLMQDKELSESELADLIGLNRSQINRIANDKSNLIKKVALAIESKTGYRATWLLTGEGGMFLSDAGNGGMAFTNEIDAYGNISQKFFKPSESKKSKTKSADVVSLEGLSDSEKEHVINTVKLFLAGKGKK